MPATVALLLLSTRFPVPVTAPLNVNNCVPEAFVSVVSLLLTVRPPLSVSAEVVLFSVIPVTFDPTAELIVVVPVQTAGAVIVTAVFTAAGDNVTAPDVALLAIVRLLLPVTPPLKLVEIAAPVLPIASVPAVFDASTIGRAIVNPVVPSSSVAFALPPALSPSVMLPAPKALALTVPSTVPDLIVKPLPVKVFTPLRFSCDVALFSITLVTLAPITELIVVLPVPVPLLVIVPMLFTAAVDNVMPLAVALLFFRIRLPAVFATPPDNVSNAVPLLFVSVVAVALLVSKPLTVSAEVVLFSVIPVTFDPTPPEITTPVPVPEFVTVPVLFTEAVENVMVLVALLLAMTRLLVPVTPPL